MEHGPIDLLTLIVVLDKIIIPHSLIHLQNTKFCRYCIYIRPNKWTRCGVESLSDDKNLFQGGQTKLGLRSHSVGKDGNPDNSGTYGMGWSRLRY